MDDNPPTPPATVSKTIAKPVHKKAKVAASKRKASEISSSPPKNFRWFQDLVQDGNDRVVLFESHIQGDVSNVPAALSTLAKELSQTDKKLQVQRMQLYSIVRASGYEADPKYAILLQHVTNLVRDQYFKREAFQLELQVVPGFKDVTLREALDMMMLTPYFGYLKEAPEVSWDVLCFIQRLIMMNQNTIEEVKDSEEEEEEEEEERERRLGQLDKTKANGLDQSQEAFIRLHVSQDKSDHEN